MVRPGLFSHRLSPEYRFLSTVNADPMNFPHFFGSAFSRPSVGYLHDMTNFEQRSGPTSESTEPCVSPGEFVLAGRDLTHSEAQSLRARGLLTPVLFDLYATSSPGTEERARAAAHYLKPQSRRVAILHRLTAAWIYGCSAAPEAIECSVGGRSGHRFGPEEVPFVRHRFTRYTPYDDLNIGGVRVTTPLRTCVDIAVHDGGRRADLVLATLLRATEYGCGPPSVCAALAALPRVKFRQRAMERVLRLGPREARGALKSSSAWVENR